MPDANKIVRDRQLAIRREMDRRGIAIKAVQFDGGWDSPSTVLSYFPADAAKEPAIMSVASLYRLFDALPLDLLSMLLPDGFQIVRVPEEIDHEELCEHMHEWLREKAAAHRLDSECGPAIGPNEHKRLTAKAVALKAVA